MNITIQNNNSSNSRTSFGHLSREAKEVVNSSAVRMILKNKYKIGAKDIRKLDETSLRFRLLSECLPELDIPQTSGLLLTSYKGSKLPNMCISSPNVNLNETGADFFAFCVKKAIDMANFYKAKVKVFGSHPVNKAWREKITEIERPLKVSLKKFTAAYNGGDDVTMSVMATNFKRAERLELKVDSKYNSIKERVNEELASDVSNGWSEINIEEYVPEARKAAKRRAR